jgi:hypothetical protein
MPFAYNGLIFKRKFFLKVKRTLLNILFLNIDPLLSSTRRLYPSLQMNIYTLNIHISNQILTFSFLPVNCTYNLLPITISQDLPVTVEILRI